MNHTLSSVTGSASTQVRVVKRADDIERCLAIRQEVFVVEQNVPVELEIDEHDHEGAVHFLASVNDQPMGTGRVCVFDGKAKIQRMAVLPSARGKKLGALIIDEMLLHIRQHQLANRVGLDAQTHATGFYERKGFRRQGEVFDDAGIDHIYMERTI